MVCSPAKVVHRVWAGVANSVAALKLQSTSYCKIWTSERLATLLSKPGQISRLDKRPIAKLLTLSNLTPFTFRVDPCLHIPEYSNLRLRPWKTYIIEVKYNSRLQTVSKQDRRYGGYVIKPGSNIRWMAKDSGCVTQHGTRLYNWIQKTLHLATGVPKLRIPLLSNPLPPVLVT